MEIKSDFEKELKLSLNKRLFELRFITEEMYIKAREQILKSV